MIPFVQQMMHKRPQKNFASPCTSAHVHLIHIETISHILSSYLPGNYSVYGLEIHLSRCVSPYLLNVYLPTAIFVVMSWVSFLIPTDVVPARIVLLVTLCLVIINTFNNVT